MASDVLTKIQSLPEFKLNTQINKAVICNIESLMSLEDEKRKHLEDLVSLVKSKVKHINMCIVLLHGMFKNR